MGPEQENTMFAFIRAAAAAFLIFEITGTFAIGLITMVLFALHLHGIAFWSVESLAAAGSALAALAFFKRALAYERSAVVETG